MRNTLAMQKRILSTTLAIGGMVLSTFCSVVAIAEDVTPKLVYLVVDENKLIASNIEFNRFDELKLQAKEEIRGKSVGNAVAVVVTNQRIVAYSVYTASWKTRDLKAGETVKSIEAEDFSALVVTSKRFLSFNGKTAVWAETQRSTIFR